MLRTNLSTRPFYNERAVHVVLAVVAILVLGVTAFNVARIVRLSRENTELATRAARDQVEAQRLAGEAASVRRAIDQTELETVAAAAQEANALIDHRTFSWTAFFNYIEETLPPDVMLIAVRPSVAGGQTRVSMTVLSRRTEDIDEFTEKLEATGAFENVIPVQADSTNEGLQRAVLESVYTAAGAEAEPSDAAPASSGGRAPASEPGGTAPPAAAAPATPEAAKPARGGAR